MLKKNLGREFAIEKANRGSTNLLEKRSSARSHSGFNRRHDIIAHLISARAKTQGGGGLVVRSPRGKLRGEILSGHRVIDAGSQSRGSTLVKKNMVTRGRKMGSLNTQTLVVDVFKQSMDIEGPTGSHAERRYHR